MSGKGAMIKTTNFKRQKIEKKKKNTQRDKYNSIKLVKVLYLSFSNKIVIVVMNLMMLNSSFHFGVYVALCVYVCSINQR